MANSEALTDLDRALAAADSVVAGIAPGQWSAPTPCTELDVRAVVNHLVTGNLLFAAILREQDLPDRDADHLGGDPVGAYRRAAAELQEAFAVPGVLESVFTAPFGTGPGVALAHVRVIEALVHGWDVTRATGQRADFPDDVAERALAVARRLMESRPEGRGAAFAAEVPVPAGAPAIDRLAGFLGRPTA